MKEELNLKKISIIVIVVYLVMGIAFYFIGGEQIQYVESNNNLVSPIADSKIDSLIEKNTIEQEFSINADAITNVNLVVSTMDRKNKGNLLVTLKNKESGEILTYQKIDVSNFKEYDKLSVDINDKIKGVKNKTLSIVIKSDIEEINNAPGLYSIKADNDLPMYINGVKSDKSLLISIEGVDRSIFGKNYWYFFSVVFFILLIYIFLIFIKINKNKRSYTVNLIKTYYKYKFLLNQLIERDFKTKYKRSVLGVLWSFFNPLLTMLVQYVVFSTIFKSDITNFPVYLLSGSVIFNFFSESCGMGLMSIIGNASLITKVYVPKYIYPISRVLSSVVNLLLALIPLFLVMLITKTPIKISLTLVPFAIICTIIFSIGISFILSSAMVFFRDTQFLWNVLILLWMYATPLFYPETIIPDRFSLILKLNPMYHFIRFVRICILDGVSPEPKAYLFCLVFSLSTFLLGALIFKRNQDKFVLNL